MKLTLVQSIGLIRQFYIYLFECGGWGGGVHRGKESTGQAGDTGSIPGSKRAPGEGSGNPVQYSCLGSPMNRGAWQVTQSMGHKSRTQLSD